MFKTHFYKNPALTFNEEDILLSDPNSEKSDLVIGQANFYKTITNEVIINAVLKMQECESRCQIQVMASVQDYKDDGQQLCTPDYDAAWDKLFTAIIDAAF